MRSQRVRVGLRGRARACDKAAPASRQWDGSSTGGQERDIGAARRHGVSTRRASAAVTARRWKQRRRTGAARRRLACAASCEPTRQGRPASRRRAYTGAHEPTPRWTGEAVSSLRCRVRTCANRACGEADRRDESRGRASGETRVA